MKQSKHLAATNWLNLLMLRGSMATRTIGVASWCMSVNAGHATVLDNAADLRTWSSKPPIPGMSQRTTHRGSPHCLTTNHTYKTDSDYDVIITTLTVNNYDVIHNN